MTNIPFAVGYFKWVKPTIFFFVKATKALAWSVIMEHQRLISRPGLQGTKQDTLLTSTGLSTIPREGKKRAAMETIKEPSEQYPFEQSADANTKHSCKFIHIQHHHISLFLKIHPHAHWITKGFCLDRLYSTVSVCMYTLGLCYPNQYLGPLVVAFWTSSPTLDLCLDTMGHGAKWTEEKCFCIECWQSVWLLPLCCIFFVVFLYVGLLFDSSKAYKLNLLKLFFFMQPGWQKDDIERDISKYKRT